MLLDLRTQLIELQEKVEVLLWYEEEKGGLDMGLGSEARGPRTVTTEEQLKGGKSEPGLDFCWT